MSGQIAHYRLDGYVGRGSRAVVYLATDQRTQQSVALKVVTPELAGDAAFRSRFLRESRMAAAVNHPNIIPVYAADDENGTLYVAMRYVPGGDARALLNRHGPLPLAWAMEIVAGVASALDAAHAHGLVHGDVRPANILLDPAGAASGVPWRADEADFGQVYLADFGMGQAGPNGEVIAAGQAERLDYAAPEQIDKQDTDGRADEYSLACAGYELLCGTPPFGQDQGLTLMYAQLYAPPPSAAARRPDLPAAVDEVLATALAKNPADRFPTCSQFADALSAALGGAAGHPGGAPAPRTEATQATPVTATWPGDVWQGAAAGAGAAQQPQQPQPPEATLAGAAPYGAGWQTPTQPQPPVPPLPLLPPVKAAPDLMTRLRGAYPKAGSLPTGKKMVLGVAAVAVAIAAIVLGLTLSGRSSPTTPAASSHPAPPATPAPSVSTSSAASRRAAAVSSLLGASASTRRSLQGAVSDVRTCSRLANATSQIRAVARQRSTEYQRASALSLAGLAGGATAKSDLLAALRTSLDADRDYLTWARQQRTSGCTPAAQSGAYATAIRADQQAGTAKAAFVEAWNPIAARYGLPRKSPGDI
jgi:hypothetical protein